MLKNKEWKLITASAGKNNSHIGDDCAVWEEKSLVITTDHMCEGIHFDLSFMPPQSVGWRLMAANASDIISMGSKPSRVLINIGVPEGKTDCARQILSGIRNFTDKYKIEVIGGDTTAAPFFMVGATMFGEKPEKPLLRSGAKPGDAVFIASAPGMSKCGLMHLQNRCEGFDLSKKRFLYPDPFSFLPSDFSVINAAIDISDSLISELSLIAEASKVHLKIDLDAIPVTEEVEKTAEFYNITVEELILGSGEEFFLLFTSEKNVSGGHKVGVVLEGSPGVEVYNKNGNFNFDHISSFLHFG
jgi:thiamine-monophosphate kinase